MPKTKKPPVVHPEHEKAFEEKRAFMKGIFEHDPLVPLVPLVELLEDAENLFVHCLYEDQPTLVACKGIKFKKGRNFLRRQQTENEKMMREVEELAENLSLLPSNAEFEHRISKDLNAFIYVYEGDLEIGGPMRAVPRQAAIVLGDGDRLKAKSGTAGAQFIVLAALPLHEPIVQYGPFVMNTRAEIEQAINDYQNNRFVISE